jgi:hypothetical protein
MPEINYQVLTPLLIAAYRIPSITAYNRLESSPRSEDFTRSLKAEVRDALWMLTRQWQFGEFQGEDAASPVTSQIFGTNDIIDRTAFPGGQVFKYDEQTPLEIKVERENIKPNLFLSVQMGTYFIKLLKKNTLETYVPELLTKYSLTQLPLTYTIHKNDTEAAQVLSSVKESIFDGYKLLIEVNDGSFDTWADTKPDASDLKNLAVSFKDWYKRLYSQPESELDSAWIHRQLEYQFDVATTRVQQQQKTFSASQYYEGHLDWFSFDLNNRKNISFETESGSATEKEHLVSFIPNTIQFKGMPHPRFWQMEENQTDFGKIDTSTTGLMHLLFAEFGLIYSNDWFMLPFPMQINTLSEIKNIMITDVFGQHILIKPAGKAPESSWQRWIMYHHTDLANPQTSNNMFYLVPAITKALESDPLEKINFLRDEMANMVWAVENVVPSQLGKGIRGKEMAMKEPPEPAEPTGEDKPKIKYILGTTVPENWIPFIPVHINGNESEIELQRAQMPAAPPAKGIILTEKPAPFFINEEEVPRAGVAVLRSYQRTRWLNGKTYLWIGRYKEAGKGEGWSNLKFDQIEDVKQAEET